MNQRILGAQQRIDSLEMKARSEQVNEDPELQAQLARYLCVLSSGLVEQAVIDILSSYSKSKGHSRTANYVDSQLKRLRNAKFSDILNLLGHFDPDWQTHFQSSTAAEIKDGIYSIVNNRNRIAHGQDTDVSLRAFSRYYQSLKIFLRELDHFIVLAE